MNKCDECLRIKRVEKKNKKLRYYMRISAISILSMLISIILHNADILNEEINNAIASIGSTVVVMDTFYYFVDQLKYSLKINQ